MFGATISAGFRKAIFLLLAHIFTARGMDFSLSKIMFFGNKNPKMKWPVSHEHSVVSQSLETIHLQ